MKQYLFKGIDGEYRVVDHDCQGRAVEIPEGADCAVLFGEEIQFNKDDHKFYYNNEEHKWKKTSSIRSKAFYDSKEKVWQRPTPTLEYLNPSDRSLHVINPENDAVPEDWVLVPEGAVSAVKLVNVAPDYYGDVMFISDKGKIYNTRLDKDWKKGSFDSAEKYVADGDKLLWSRYTQPEPLPFIDDEPVQQTLNQRQQQYGDFEDVAETTEDLFQVLKGGASFVDLSKSQRMALYMICSKMARLVNGDVNHRDGWHDISGYSQLIDKKL